MPVSAAGEEPVGRVVEAERGPDEEQLREGPLVERQGDLRRDALAGRAVHAGPGDRDERAVVGERTDRGRQRRPLRGAARPGEPERRQPGGRLGAGGGLDLGRGQQVGERVQVVADADPALRAGLEGSRPAAAERVEHDVAAAAVAADERVGEGGREAGEVRAHRVEGGSPQPLLVLPLGRDVDRGEARRGARQGSPGCVRERGGSAVERQRQLGRGRGPAVERHRGRGLLTGRGPGSIPRPGGRSERGRRAPGTARGAVRHRP